MVSAAFYKERKKHHVSLCCMVQCGFVNPCARIHNPCALPNIQASVPHGAFCRWPHPTSESNLSNAWFKGKLQFNAIVLSSCITLFFGGYGHRVHARRVHLLKKRRGQNVYIFSTMWPLRGCHLYKEHVYHGSLQSNDFYSSHFWNEWNTNYCVTKNIHEVWFNNGFIIGNVTTSAVSKIYIQ